MEVAVEAVYRPHLTDADRALLVAAGAGEDRLVAALGAPAIEAAVFEPTPARLEPWSAASPFLTFAVAVHRSAARLRHVTHVHEWAGPRQRLPVFDVGGLRAVLDDPLRRFLLVELLASYTHVASGVRWERTARGWERHRFSELDLVSLAATLDGDIAHDAERAGIYRRLGDLALFLTGVFPDHSATTALRAIDVARLTRRSQLAPEQVEDLSGVAVLEHLGARWYHLAARALGGAGTGSAAVLDAMGDAFVAARRVLNVVTDWYLFPQRSQWFGPS